MPRPNHRDDDDRPDGKSKGSGATVLIVSVIGAVLLVLLLVCAGAAGIIYWSWTTHPVAGPQAQAIPEVRPNNVPPPQAPPNAAPKGNVNIGAPAPEIEGEDLDGKRFKLSDYRGKVVLLDFWGNW